ncbi:MAG: SDR family NAD(P)-dependent oxidoreductase [Campylobacterales bacterium]|nr:SDR family NAD(P)-dependent oxidoreductase [Campylobacterales bacterium]
MKLKNKTAFITGASAGIGKRCAKELAKRGVNLILLSRRKEKLKKLKEKLSKYDVTINIYAADVTQYAQIEKIAKELQARSIVPNILINNAGLSQGLDAIDTANVKDWDRMIDTNLKGLLYVSRLIIPMMKELQDAHIINLGSIAGRQVYAGGSVYNATKFGVHALNDAMNIDLFGTKVKVTNVAPGAVETEFSMVRFHGDKTKADGVYAGYTPLNAKDVTESILFALKQPTHVNIQEIFLTPTAQRTTYLTHRETL